MALPFLLQPPGSCIQPMVCAPTPQSKLFGSGDLPFIEVKYLDLCQVVERAVLPWLGFLAGGGKKSIAHKKLLLCPMGTSVFTWGPCQKIMLILSSLLLVNAMQ